VIKLNPSVCLFVPYARHSFGRIWTKFGKWRLYTLQMVMGRLASAGVHYRALLVPAGSSSECCLYTLLASSIELAGSWKGKKRIYLRDI